MKFHVIQSIVSVFYRDVYCTVIVYRFSKEYVASREEYPEMLEFYRDYDPPLLPGRYSCVGLAGDLATRLSVLETTYPGIKDATYQVNFQSAGHECQFPVCTVI